jgi:predicted transcriptional regulator of viral defense system
MRISILEELAKKGDTFSIENVLSTTNIQKEVLWVILSRLEKKGWIERIEKGKYMIIPLGAEKGKYTLNEFIIGSLLVNPYCVAYWSALNFYGSFQILFSYRQHQERRNRQLRSLVSDTGLLG